MADGNTKGIVLAAGRGTRLFPVTRAVSKHLLPVYNKPMIYYPLSALMFAGVRDILVIVNPGDEESYRRILGHGAQWGLSLSYAVQPEPDGIARSLIIGRRFIGNDRIALILGDNIFYGGGFPQLLSRAKRQKSGATLFAYWVRDPERFGVVQFDKNFAPVSIEEKPQKPKSNWAVTGLYFYNNEAIEIASSLTPSSRGELEITDLNSIYLARKDLHIARMSRGYAWLDTGDHDALLEASEFVRTVEHRQGLKIACLEEIAYRQGFIDADGLARAADALGTNDYGLYVKDLVANL